MKTKYVFLAAIFFSLSSLPINAATYTVTNTNDSGPGSLRAAVEAANTTPDDDVINFEINGCPNNVCTINLTSGQLTVSSADSAGILSISNAAEPHHLVISGHNTSRIFHSVAGSDLTISGLTITRGSANFGGGILNQGRLRILNSIVQECTSTNYWSGGGIANDRGTLIIERTEIRQNTATWGGGGIFSWDGPLRIADSTIAENVGYGGGGIDITSWAEYDWTASISNSTLSGNISRHPDGDLTPGGAVWLANSKVPVYFINVTVTQNLASWGGAVVADGLVGGSMYYRNSIFAGNAAVGNPDLLSGFFNDLGNNLVGASPMLGPLTNNGGPTRTHALLPGSPAIDAGNSCVLAENGCGDGNPALVGDQRGFGRSGAVDIGAFEVTTQATVFEITGRVTTSAGLPIRGARIVLEDGAGNLRFASTNPFGYFRFQDVPAGTYTTTVRSKRHGSTSLAITVSSSISDLNLIL